MEIRQERKRQASFSQARLLVLPAGRWWLLPGRVLAFSTQSAPGGPQETGLGACALPLPLTRTTQSGRRLPSRPSLPALPPSFGPALGPRAPQAATRAAPSGGLCLALGSHPSAGCWQSRPLSPSHGGSSQPLPSDFSS